MSRFTNPRRWAAHEKRRRAAKMTEDAVTPDEAREALNAIVLQTGHELERVYEYDPQQDVFRVVARNADGKLIDITVRGETVAKTVTAARILANRPSGLVRPSDLAAKNKAQRLRPVLPWLPQ